MKWIKTNWLRSWRVRTALKGIRERWPLWWWRRFARQVRAERQSVLHVFTRKHFDIDLKVRRLERLYGKEGAIPAMVRSFNAALGFGRWGWRTRRREDR